MAPHDVDQFPDSHAKARSSLIAVMAILVAFTLWILSVSLPVWETRSDHGQWRVVTGALPLMIGFLGIFAWCPAWFANLLLIPLCFTLFKGRRAGFWLSVLALAIAATAYMMPALYGDNETDVIVKRRIGFYLWVGSFLVIMLAHAVQASRADGSSATMRWAVVAVMVLAVASLNHLFRVGVSPLEASLRDPNDFAKFDAALGSRPSQADKDAALHWAILQDLQTYRGGPVPRRIARLVAAGANVNQADRYGDTPLAQAIRSRGTEPLVRLLIHAGANVNARDWRGKTILDIAQEFGNNAECQQILVDAGAVTSGAVGQPPAKTPATHQASPAL
jgi:hypothetical protein